MSIEEEIPAVGLISTRLRDLLARARTTKTTTAEVANLTTGNQYSAIETVARNIFNDSLRLYSIDQPDFVDVWNLLDILQICADLELCESSLALWLVEELLDSQTIDGCRKVFDYLESRREQLITNAFSSGKQLVLLRSCNELLRRLSRAEDAVFCGRVFIFLFQSFPLGDKSSVNLRGEFHVENLTTFDDLPTATDEQETGDRMEVDTEEAADNGLDVKAEEEGKADGDIKAAPVPYSDDTASANISSKGQDSQLPDKIEFGNLYSKFWSMQQTFSNPTKAFAQNDFTDFKSSLELTIKAFKAVSKLVQTKETVRQGESNTRSLKRTRSRESDELASSFNPKYLTNKDLFELELSDLTFQRHILVQALILLDFLLTLTPKAKKQLATLKAQKAMLFNYTLSDEDATWATTTRAMIAGYLQDGPEGKFYYRMVDNVLSRDKNWVRWKIESCPPITKDPTPTEEYMSARSGAKRAFANKRIRATPMGAADTSFLSDTQNINNLETLRNPPKTPDTQAYLKEIGNIDLDLEMAGKEEAADLVQRRAVKTWNLLRIAAKSKLALFSEVDETKTLGKLGEESSGPAKVSQAGETGGTKDVEMEGDAAVASSGAGGNGEARLETAPESGVKVTSSAEGEEGVANEDYATRERTVEETHETKDSGVISMEV